MIPSPPSDPEELRQRIDEMAAEHRLLDEEIARANETQGGDQLAMQRLKKRKLLLKDQIAQLKAMLLPDIIA